MSAEENVEQSLRDHWHKIMAAAMKKLGFNEITLTPEDIQALNGDAEVLLAHVRKDESLVIRLLPVDEAIEFAARHKGPYGIGGD